MSEVGLARRVLAEFVGTGVLVTAVVGSGIMAVRLSPVDVGLQLLENCLATVFALGALIVMFGPVSGAHFNPVVTVADWLLGRAAGTGVGGREVWAYVAGQAAGAVGGAVLANLMFGLDAVTWSGTHRSGSAVRLGEVVATAGLVLLVCALNRSGRGAVAPVAVAAYIAAACWFTSSTAFANPAVTLGRAFSDTFAGIAPGSVVGFVLAQFVGLGVGLGLTVALFPHAVPAPTRSPGRVRSGPARSAVPRRWPAPSSRPGQAAGSRRRNAPSMPVPRVRHEPGRRIAALERPSAPPR